MTILLCPCMFWLKASRLIFIKKMKRHMAVVALIGLVLTMTVEGQQQSKCYKHVVSAVTLQM